MPLISKLFRNDSTLQKCLVQDGAHVTKGAHGPHVEKIQQALTILDGAKIADIDVNSSTYGDSTADAVLAYKTARNIVNRSYQQKADNIVGKMTIASLDDGMVRSEARRLRSFCTDQVVGSGRSDRAFTTGDAPSQEKFPGVLQAIIHPVMVKGEIGAKLGEFVAEMPLRADELLSPYKLKLNWNPGRTFNFPFMVKYDQLDEMEKLRQFAEDVMPGFRNAIRVLITIFRDHDDVKDFNTNAVSIESSKFGRFIVVNSNILRADHGTLLHEMIHCTRTNLMLDLAHDADSTQSIFSWAPNRTHLPREYAKALHESFFCEKK